MGAPLLIAVITVASTAGPQNYISKRNACWLNWYESKALLAFVIPALTIVAINLLVFDCGSVQDVGERSWCPATQPDEKHALVVIARYVAIFDSYLWSNMGIWNWNHGVTGIRHSCGCLHSSIHCRYHFLSLFLTTLRLHFVCLINADCNCNANNVVLIIFCNSNNLL